MKLVHATSLHGESDHRKSPDYLSSRRSFSAMTILSMQEGWGDELNGVNEETSTQLLVISWRGALTSPG